MPSVRIIPCLDVAGGRVVKGVRFEGHRDVGGIEEHTAFYVAQGADELVYYDIGASPEGRSVELDWIARVARLIDIPFCVAGGIRTRDQAAAALGAGADKISINSPALERPDLIAELARDFGSQCVVVGIDSLAEGASLSGANGAYRVRQYTGSAAAARDAGRETLAWAREVAERGAGEIVLNCMSRDGVRTGYDLAHTRAVVDAVEVPVIASGGAGSIAHFRDAFIEAGASGALAATVFHDRLIAIPVLKEELARCAIDVRR